MTDEALLKYIASLSDEEREKYKPLIEEALRQDGALDETFGRMKAEFKNLEESLKHLLENTSRLQAAHSSLKKKLKANGGGADSSGEGNRWN